MSTTTTTKQENQTAKQKAERVVKEAKIQDNKEEQAVSFVMTDPNDTTEYVVFAATMTILNADGKSETLTQGQVITKADYPSTWVDIAVDQHLLIKQSDLKTMSPEVREANGYTGTKPKTHKVN